MTVRSCRPPTYSLVKINVNIAYKDLKNLLRDFIEMSKQRKRNQKSLEEKGKKVGGVERKREGERERQKLTTFSSGIQFPHQLTVSQKAAYTNQMKLFKQSWKWQCFGFSQN